MAEMVNSAGDDRTANNAVRHQHRVLSEEEKAAMVWLKDNGAAFINYVNEIKENGTAPREMSLAITKMEEAVFWAVKGITG